MHTAGDYHAQGYVAAITSTYLINVVRIDVDVLQTAHGAMNVTAAGLWSLLQAGTTYFVGFTLKGTAGQGGVYGRTWTAGEFYQAYSAGTQELEIFHAYDPNDPTKVDITQPNYGMIFIQERLSATTWLQFDIWIHTSGDMPAANTYYIHLNIGATNPVGTVTNNNQAFTLTG